MVLLEIKVCVFLDKNLLQTQPIHWYFTSALPRALLVAYPLSLVGYGAEILLENFISNLNP